MQTTIFDIKTKDGLILEAKSYIPDFRPLGVVCIIHGLGDQQDRYVHVAEYFTNSKLAVYTIDLRGHGKSEGKRGHTPNYGLLLDDLDRFIDIVKNAFPDLPLFLYGHSMGGNIVANYILKKDITGIKAAILTSPWFKLSFNPPGWQVKLGRFMNLLYAAFSQNNVLDPREISSDPAVQKAYATDPLVHGKISARMFVSVYDAGLNAVNKAASINIPMLIMHGEDDNITSKEASALFAKKSGIKATFKSWPDLKHELHNEMEPARKEVLEYITEWILRNLN